MPQLNEAERLSEYYDFDDDILAIVSDVAGAQRAQTPESFIADLPVPFTFSPSRGEDIEIIDIVPKGGHDGTFDYHLPMGNTLDENMRARIATLAKAAPTKRIIARSNPGAPGRGIGKLRATSMPGVWMGDLTAAVEAELEYLKDHREEEVSHIGFSYGSEKAMTAAINSERYDQKVGHAVAMEPISVKKRNLGKLTVDFMSTAAALDGYVKASDSAAYLKARDLGEKTGHGLVGYSVGLARASNIAIAHALGRNMFEIRTADALDAQPDMKAEIIWGTESELSIDALLTKITEGLMQRFGTDRVETYQINKGKHAWGDEVFLHTAAVLQTTKN